MGTEFNVSEEVTCINEKCNRRFRRFKKAKVSGGSRASGVRRANSLTCSHKCSVEWEKGRRDRK